MNKNNLEGHTDYKDEFLSFSGGFTPCQHLGHLQDENIQLYIYKLISPVMMVNESRRKPTPGTRYLLYSSG